MKILSFESSCDETAVAVLSAEGDCITVLSSTIATQIDIHRLYGGVVPEIASRAHIDAISRLTYGALSESGCTLSEIDLVAVTANPGLIGALLVAVNFAKSLAISNGIPLVPVDHIKGHIAAAYLNTETPPKPPFLALALSGGHTSIYRVDTYTDYKVIGQTRDDAIGESFDKIGRMIGIPYPAGKGFDALSREGFIEATGKNEGFYSAYKKAKLYREGDFALPSPALNDGTLDFSFSGLKTAAINLLHRYEQKALPLNRALFAARYTYEVCEAVAKKISLAIDEHPELQALVVAGGVAANSHLREVLTAVAKKKGIPLFIPALSLCGDNAAMIGAQGYYEYRNGKTANATLNASAMDSI